MLGSTNDEKFKKSFEQFGIEFEKQIDDQLIADCPFSGKRSKLYVNPKTGQWDSKSASLGGNLYTFIREMVSLCKEETTSVELSELSDSRRLPIKAFKDKVFYNALNDEFLIPEYNIEGKLSGCGHYKVGSKMVVRTKNTKVSVNGLHEAKGNDFPIYICEGEWDWIALQWLHNDVGHKSVVICLPGANTFKTEWTPVFNDRKVYTCYDNDQAGEKGEAKAENLLKGSVSDLKFLRWLDLHPDKYDVRDFIVENANPMTPRNKSKKCFEMMSNMFSYTSRQGESISSSDAGTEEAQPPEEFGPPPSTDEIEKAYGAWLKMSDFDPLAYMFGVCFANRIPGDPIWGFIVAPPGGSKTELLMTLNKSPLIETVSTLTPASLISGMRMPDGQDPSIIPRLNNRMLVVKDFTTILSMHAFQRDEVFGILRDAYDGYIEKQFGNGLIRKYESTFGILAGVTPTIDTFQSVHSSLGERFIKYRMDRNLMPETEEERLMRVLNNINHESAMRAELQKVGARVMSKKIDLETLPTFSPEIAQTVIKLARYTAKLRSAVDRDRYTDALQSIPTTEVATRLTKVYMKLAMGVAIYYDDPDIGDNSLRVLRKVAIDTAPAMQEHTVKSIYTRWYDSDGEEVSSTDVLKDVPFCNATLAGVLNDLVTLGIIKKIKGQNGVKSYFVPTQNTVKMIQGAGIY